MHQLSNYFTPCFFVMAVFINACTGTRPGIFTKKTAHETYSSNLQAAGLAKSRLGLLWEKAAASGLTQPEAVMLPFKEIGYFDPVEPRAMGYKFSLKRGEQVLIVYSTRPAKGYLFFAELWKVATGSSPQFVMAADTSNSMIRYTVEQAGEYLLRIQPELLQGVSYSIDISTGPSLAFPLNKSDRPKIISVWGAERDAGARSHEGIDILVKKRTPVVAAANGYISSVSENNLGGKVVFLNPENNNINLYYAHHDTQWVSNGQRVTIGDTLGLTGNTGNARNTVSHLHFGIYASGGAIDPLPFIALDRPVARPVTADTQLLGRTVRLVKRKPTTDNEIGTVIAASDISYLLESPNGSRDLIKQGDITYKFKEKKLLKSATAIYEKPDSTVAVKSTLPAGQSIAILGEYRGFQMIESDKLYGWIKKS